MSGWLEEKRTEMHGVAAAISDRPTRRPEILENAAASVRDEAGCRQFDVAQDASKPEQFFLYEIYDDEAAFKAHMETPHFIRWRDATKEWIEETSIQPCPNPVLRRCGAAAACRLRAAGAGALSQRPSGLCRRGRRRRHQAELREPRNDGAAEHRIALVAAS